MLLSIYSHINAITTITNPATRKTPLLTLLIKFSTPTSRLHALHLMLTESQVNIPSVY